MGVAFCFVTVILAVTLIVFPVAVGAAVGITDSVIPPEVPTGLCFASSVLAMLDTSSVVLAVAGAVRFGPVNRAAAGVDLCTDGCLVIGAVTFLASCSDNETDSCSRRRSSAGAVDLNGRSDAGTDVLLVGCPEIGAGSPVVSWSDVSVFSLLTDCSDVGLIDVERLISLVGCLDVGVDFLLFGCPDARVDPCLVALSRFDVSFSLVDGPGVDDDCPPEVDC